MGRLPRWDGKKIIKVFEKDGWRFSHIEGSHHIFMKEGLEVTLSIPVHGKKALKIGLLKGLIRDSGMTNEKFLNLCYKRKYN